MLDVSGSQRNSAGEGGLTSPATDRLTEADPMTGSTRRTQRWPHDEVLHAWWVLPGRLLAGEYPGAKTPEITRDKVARLIDAGVTSIVDLTTGEDRLQPYLDTVEEIVNEEGWEGRPVKYSRSHPIPDMSAIDQQGYDAIVRYIRDELADGRVVYVHCWGGMGRTTTVVGALLIDDGLDYAATITRIAELRAGTRKAHVPCPQSAIQHRALKERAAARSSAIR
ncbi:protein-tyrosine phosphatase family protein [Mycobacterium kansasii]|uniref:protein-tyrosine phosphatase family protein n=1 Tax=Mycobacterium kansasii TaxID=1768 RepID=UPI001CE329C2|nr:serine/threonine protein phosphatase [Mycobacterium kansasii]UCA22851.1 serine/threonine protein phosphatase [Mycobacterium kansasii]